MTSEVADLASFDLIGAWNTYWGEGLGAPPVSRETGSVDPGAGLNPDQWPDGAEYVPSFRVWGSDDQLHSSRMHLALRSRRPRRSNRARQSPHIPPPPGWRQLNGCRRVGAIRRVAGPG